MRRAARPFQDRQTIKRNVRISLQGRVFSAFLAVFLPGLLSWVLRLFPMDFGLLRLLIADLYIYQFSLPMMALSLLLTIFVTDPMVTRVAAYFLALNRTSEKLPSPLSVCDCFGPGYWRLVKGMLLRNLYTTVATLLPLCIGALIPGTWSIEIISEMSVIRVHALAYPFILASGILTLNRTLAYIMVPYVLADRPELGPVEALRRGTAITRGRIWELLVLDFSFFGWLLLVSITMMIGAVYVYPYIEATMAAYYIAFDKPMPWEAIAIEDAA